MEKSPYHFIGIGGIGMSGLAGLLLKRGDAVSGSDIVATPLLEALMKNGARIHIGHSEEALVAPAKVIYSSAVKPDNPELLLAKRLNLPLLHRSELLRDLMLDSRSLLVTGTHGKTTTSALLAHTLIAANFKPSFCIGGMLRGVDNNAGFGEGQYFVAEADESDGSFLNYSPYGAIITNVDDDHLDYWKTSENLDRGFSEFVSKVASSKHLLWCYDDERLRDLKIKGISYGFHEKSDAIVRCFYQRGWKTFFDLEFNEKLYNEIEIPLIGGHNVLNAAAVFVMAITLKVKEKDLRAALASFPGVGRRCEHKGDVNEISIFDDYAHHPTEILATLRALKVAVGDRHLIVAFQPHRYTRTRDCLDIYPQAFAHADELILTDIYSAGEKPIEGIDTELLLARIKERSSIESSYVPRKDLVKALALKLKPHDVLVTMGAGDITKVPNELMQLLTSK